MRRLDHVEELLDFLLTRIDESGLTELVDHEPRRMYATYLCWSSGRGLEDRQVWFAGCATCSRLPSRVVVNPVTGAETVLWRVIDVNAWRDAAPPHEGRHGPTPHKIDVWPDFSALDIATWPCRRVRLLALPFADDPHFWEGWRPEYALLVSGKLVRPDGELQWPWELGA